MPSESVENSFRAERPWRTLLGLYWPERRWVALAMLSYLFKASPLWVLPVITANIVDIIARHAAGGVRSLCANLLVGAVVIVQNVASTILYVNCLSRAVRNVEVRLRSALVRRLQILSIAYHARADIGRLQTKFLRDVESIEQLSRQLVETGELAVMSIVLAVAVTAWRMPIFVPVFVCFVPLVWLVRRLVAGPLKRYNEALRRQLEGMNSLVLGMITMILTTRAHAAEEIAITCVEKQFGSVKSAARSFDKVAGRFGATGWVLLMLFNFAGLTAGACLSYTGVVELSPGDILLLSGYFNAIMHAVMQLNALLPMMARGFDALRSIGEVIECSEVEENGGKRRIDAPRGDFRFEDVTFRYTDTGPAVLKKLTLHIRAGEVIGVVGPSGCGKSTLASLIAGFHRPSEGRILLDGNDMNDIDLRSFRRYLALVGQKTILYTGTLRENVTYGTERVTECDLLAALDAANATKFVQDLPRGLETVIGAGGTQLSGGQEQRIAIARALLRNPRVLILDEATSALDPDSEMLVKKALERLIVGRTTFIIAHRPYMIGRVNRLFELQGGTVSESGRFPDGDRWRRRDAALTS